MFLTLGLSSWLLFTLFSATATPASNSCNECSTLIDWDQFDGRQPLEWTLIDGQKRGIKPGDVICLKGNMNRRITFRNIHGTEEKPIIIRNEGETVHITSDGVFGLKFENSRNFKLLGNGGSKPYGIVVSTKKGYFVSFENFTTDFEIAHVEIAGPSPNGIGEEAGFAGLMIKTSPYQDCQLFSDSTRQAWIMRNVIIHDNYIHDTGGEGMYIGHGFYKGREEKKCPGAGKLYSHSIQNLKIYNNRLKNIGYDGMQIKNADADVEVYNNTVTNYGTRNHNAHNEGLFIGEGTTGMFHDNIIDTGTGNGCKIQGIGNLDICNNLFINSGKNGIYATGGAYATRWKSGYFNISHNTIYNSAEYGFLFYGEGGGRKVIKDNLVVNASKITKKGAHSDQSGNFFSNNSIDKNELSRYPLQVNSSGIQDDKLLEKYQKYLQQAENNSVN